MIPISIDITDFAVASAMTDEEMASFTSLLLDRLEEGFKEQWINQVNRNLHSTRIEYMRAMFTDRPTDNSVVMGVTARESQLAVDLELGKEPFDEKVGFSRSAKRHLKRRGGWYLTVPFRHATPLALGESAAFTSVMPLAVYRLARRATRPLTLQQLPTAQQVRTVRPEIRTSTGRVYLAYQRKTARYESLMRIPHTPERRGGYYTFRRVSDLSDENSWIHPGFTPRNLLGKALQETDIESIVRRAKIEFYHNYR